MVAHVKSPYITPEQYLAIESESDVKSEYIDGVIIAMSGSSRQHDAIAASIAGELYPLLRSSGCRAFTSSMRVRLQSSNRYYYPDHAICCETPLFEVNNGVDSLLNPTVIIEILSPSTERQDRGEKWLAYRQIDTLTAYLLVHQDKPLIEVLTRKEPELDWQQTDLAGLDATLSLPGIPGQIALSSIYADVDFDAIRPE